MKAIVIGIMSQEKIRERILAVARGEHKQKPTDPKIWFTSMRSLAEVLSDENRALLKVIKDTHPQSISPCRNHRAQTRQPISNTENHVELRHRRNET
jgi:predicted transcriptional regulator